MFAVPNLTTEPLLTINMSILPLKVDSQQVEFIHDYVWGVTRSGISRDPSVVEVRY
jgi:hypothetical protein